MQGAVHSKPHRKDTAIHNPKQRSTRSRRVVQVSWCLPQQAPRLEPTMVQQQTSSIPHLIKQLKRQRFSEAILITIYKSLVLSHINYSSPALASTTEAVKSEIQRLHNRILRIIGINLNTARVNYKVTEIDQYIDSMVVKKFQKLLSDSNHQLTSRVTTIDTRTGLIKYKVAKARTSKYKNSLVQKSLHTLRDNIPNLYTTANATGAPKKKRVAPAIDPSIETTKTVIKRTVPCALCGKQCEEKLGLRTHLKKCARKQTVAKPPMITNPFI